MVWAIPPNLHKQTFSGPRCFHREHNLGSRDGKAPRYSDSYACTRCVAALTEGRFEINIHNIEKTRRKLFLRFWSLVDISGSDECWEWQGKEHSKGGGIFQIKRHWSSNSWWSAPRVAFWFSHGDIGRLPIEHICGNGNCCNPLHLRVKGVPHYFASRHLRKIDLDFSARKLVCETGEFLKVTQARDPERYRDLLNENESWIASRVDPNYQQLEDTAKGVIEILKREAEKP